MADFGVKVEPVRKGGKLRGKVTGFRVSWWRKNAEQLKEAYKEIRQPKVGRIARLTGKVENMAPHMPMLEAETTAGQLDPVVEAEVHEMLERMRAEERQRVAAK